LASYGRAAELRPDFAEAHCNLADALARRKLYGDAVPAYRRAIALRPDLVGAQLNLGNALYAAHRFPEAQAAFEATLAVKPDLFEAQITLGNALYAQQQYEKAAAAFDVALGLKPGDPDAHANLGNALFMLERLDEALANYSQALAAVPDHPAALGMCTYLRRQTCDWTDIARDEARLMERIGTGEVTVEPFMFLAISEDPALQLACAKHYWQKTNQPSSPHVRRNGAKHDRIRLGYYSGNFRTSATAFLTAQLYELHDRQRFEVYGLSYGPDEDSSMRRRLKQGFDQLVDLQRASDDAIAAAIREHEIDIVVDLKGYQKHSRMNVLARRPAPVQVHYICHPGTLGVDFIDYAFVDAYLVPPEQQVNFSERLVFLPGSYLVTDQKRAIADSPPSRVECGLPPTGFVFCCFNNTYKITPPVFDVWMRLLTAVPGSVLWLIADNHWAEANLRRQAQARGVDPARLVFAPRVKLPEHLARHRHADLFVDTWPYCAHTTATDALWAGLPLLTLTGRSFASRVAASLMRAAEMPELITDTLADYEALALRLAREPALLAALKAKLTGDLTRLPVFDMPRKVRDIEAAYARMWDLFQAGEAPQSFKV
jgi:predicted O-linked N-acetylglucosamine transferase (SPINDLY family)